MTLETLQPADTLSTRILGEPCTSGWMELFTQSAAASHIRFESATAVVICAHLASPGDDAGPDIDAELRSIAHANGGECDLQEPGLASMLFLDPARALDAALHIQRVCAGRGLRIGLAAGSCETAWVEIRTGVRKFHLGEAVEHAQSLSALAPGGTLRICPGLSLELLPQIDALTDRLVTTEVDAHGLGTVCLALLPRPSDLLSSFAGLGLV